MERREARHTFLVVGNECLGNCLADSINLACLTSSTDSDTDVDIPELLLSGNQNRLLITDGA